MLDQVTWFLTRMVRWENKVTAQVQWEVFEICGISSELLLVNMDVMGVDLWLLNEALESDNTRIVTIGNSNRPPQWDILFDLMSTFQELFSEIQATYIAKPMNEKLLREKVYELAQVNKVIEESYRRLGYIDKKKFSGVVKW